MEYGKMTRLDMHVHCNSTDINDLTFLAEQCRRMGTMICLSGGLRYGGHDYAPNEEVIEICKKFPDCFILLFRADYSSHKEYYNQRPYSGLSQQHDAYRQQRKQYFLSADVQ